MQVPIIIQQAAKDLRAGQRIGYTVREFLIQFDVRGRGAHKVRMIRAILDSLGLETVPDFRAGSLDDPILLCLKSAESNGNVFNDGHASQGSLFPKNGASAVGPLDRVPVVPKAMPPPTVRPDIKQQLLAHGAVARLLKNQQWAQPAHAAIAHFTDGKPCPVASWRRSSTWQQVQMAFNEIISSRV